MIRNNKSDLFPVPPGTDTHPLCGLSSHGQAAPQNACAAHQEGPVYISNE